MVATAASRRKPVRDAGCDSVWPRKKSGPSQHIFTIGLTPIYHYGTNSTEDARSILQTPSTASADHHLYRRRCFRREARASLPSHDTCSGPSEWRSAPTFSARAEAYANESSRVSWPRTIIAMRGGATGETYNSATAATYIERKS